MLSMFLGKAANDALVVVTPLNHQLNVCKLHKVLDGRRTTRVSPEFALVDVIGLIRTEFFLTFESLLRK